MKSRWFLNPMPFPLYCFPSIAKTEGMGWHHRWWCGTGVGDWVAQKEMLETGLCHASLCLQRQSHQGFCSSLQITRSNPPGTKPVCLWSSPLHRYVRQHLPQQQPGSSCWGVTLLWWSQEQDLSLGLTSQGQDFTCSPLAGVVFSVYSGRCFTEAGPVSVCQEALVLLFWTQGWLRKARVFFWYLLVAGGLGKWCRWDKKKDIEGKLEKQGALKQHCSKHTHYSRNALQATSSLL